MQMDEKGRMRMSKMNTANAIMTTSTGSGMRRVAGKRHARHVGWAGLAIAGLLLAGCSSLGSAAQQDRSFVLSSDVKSDIQAAELPMVEGEQTLLSEAIRFSNLLSVQGDGTLLFNRDHGLYRANMETLGKEEAEQLLDIPVIEVSQNGKKALYEQGETSYMLDIATGKQTKLLEYSGGMRGIADTEGNYVSFQQAGAVLQLVNTDTGNVQTIPLEDHFTVSNFSNGPAKYVDGYLYLDISGEDTPRGIYKIAADGQSAEPLLLLPNAKTDSLAQFDLLADGRLLFDGVYDKEPGIFVYSPVTKTVSLLVAGNGTGAETRTPFYSLSPDQSKLLFHIYEQAGGADHIFQAELKEDRIENSRPILRHPQLYAGIMLLTHWSDDSASFYVKLTPWSEENQSGNVESIVSYQF
ncbi:hypothetical protein EBB07_10675 [Paenibacillaceae bacterium]|nr:hypothetical protein EBB07_10675 [Paenibacillaceae bacterium]